MEGLRGFSILPFVEARAREIEALTKIVGDVKSNKRVFQTLPRHMRRRAMSHNIKRLPRRLRHAAQTEMDKQNPPSKNKRPSRKHRRRPRNLLQEYARRKRKHVWLETHVWHAKRFKMADLWGYRVPVKPNDKGERAAYRATAKHCLMQDISYFGCIELKGPEVKILDGFRHLTSTEIGLTVAAKACLNGGRHSTVILYEKDAYPLRAIGPVSFLWRSDPVQHDQQDVNSACEHSVKVNNRQLWVWSHPSCFVNVLEQLKCVFLVTDTGRNSFEPSTSENGESIEKISGQDDVPTEKSSNKSGVTVTSLKDSLLRFRLTGPLIQAVLNDTLKPAVIKSSEDVEGNGDHAATWWSEHYTTSRSRAVHEVQSDLWRSLQGVQSPGELSPHCVLSCTVRDPRIFLPRKRSKAMSDPRGITSENLPVHDKLPVEASISPLWDADIRQKVKATKISEYELNQRRSKLLVPGSELELGVEESRIPVILLQRPGKQTDQLTRDCSLGYGCGWDIILPAGWGMAFWVALIYRGARAGGLKEMKATSMLECVPHFPDDMPDTAAGKLHETAEKNELLDKYNRRPPSKRPNYVKLGAVTPFHCPWSQLIREWRQITEQAQSEHTQVSMETDTNQSTAGMQSKGIGDLPVSQLGISGECFMVMRARKQLRLLQSLCLPSNNNGGERRKKVPRHRLSQRSVHHQPNTSGDHLSSTFSQLLTDSQCRQSLVPVKLDLVLRGTAQPFSMLCIPTPEDLKLLSEDKKYAGPVEPLHKDPSKAQRKKKKKDCKGKKNSKESALDADMRKVLKASVEGDIREPTHEVKMPDETEKSTEKDRGYTIKTSSEDPTAGQGDTAPVPEASINKSSVEHGDISCIDSSAKMHNIECKATDSKVKVECPTKEVESVVNSCGREIIGYVKHGGYALSSGHGAGLGFCTCIGILKILKTKGSSEKAVVLVRSPRSLQYRFAYLSVIV